MTKLELTQITGVSKHNLLIHSNILTHAIKLCCRPCYAHLWMFTSRSASAYELMSVNMTRTCFPHSYAKYSAVVKAIRGVIILSIVGSFACAKKKKKQTYKCQRLIFIELNFCIQHKILTQGQKYLKKVSNLISQITRFRKRVTLSIDPFSSKSRLKNCAVSMLTPIAANTIAKLSSSTSCRIQCK